MAQQINLFPPSLRPRPVPLAARALVPLVGLIVVALAAVWGWERSRLAALERDLSALRQASQDRQAELDELRKRIGARKSDPRLAAELDRAETLYRSRERAMQALQSGALGDPAGFSETFRAFARQSVDGLWLTGVQLGGGDLRIEGRALAAELVPRYLRQLSAEASLKGRSFAELQIAQPRTKEAAQAGAAATPAPMPFVEFSVGTAVAAARAEAR